jgi:hypothetical protein
VPNLILFGKFLNQVRGKLRSSIGDNFSWYPVKGKNIFIKEFYYSPLDGMWKCLGLHPFNNIIYTDQNMDLLVGWRVICPYEVQDPFLKRLYNKLGLEWHFIGSDKLSHPLKTITTSHIPLCIMKHIRPIVAYAKYCVIGPFIDKVSTTRLIVTSLKNAIDFILSDTMSDHKI